MRRRREFLRLTGLAGVGSVAGCSALGGGGSNGDDEDEDDEGVPREGTPNDTPTDTPTPTQTGDATLDGPLAVGVLAPWTGKKNPIGNSIAKSAKLAARQLNAAGGVLGADVEVLVRETNSEPEVGITKYQELVVGEGVDVTTGVFTNDVLLALMDGIASRQRPHLTAGATSVTPPEMVSENYDRYKYWFRTGPLNGRYQGENMVDFAAANSGAMGWDSVYVLVEDYEWTVPVERALTGHLSGAGVDVAGFKRYSGDTKDFGPIYDQVEQSGADAVYVAMAHTGTPAVIQWANQRRPFAFGGINVPLQLPSYYGLVKGACRYAVVPNASTPRSPITDKTVPYANAYRKMVGKYPVYPGYAAYDAVTMYAAAVEAAGSRDPDDVVAQLESMRFTGTTGTVRYHGPNGRFPHDVVYDRSGTDGIRPVWFQWQERNGRGRQVALHPGSVERGRYRQPPWL